MVRENGKVARPGQTRDAFGGAGPDDDYQDHRPDRCLLCFWPADCAADAILRCGSSAAAYWHDWAAGPPPPLSLSAQVEAELRVRAERDRRAQRYRLQDEARRQGDARGRRYLAAGLLRPG